MNTIQIKKNCDRRIQSGHLWLFSNELATVPKYVAGEVVTVESSNGKSLGKGFYNPNSLIAVRLLSTETEIDKDFFVRRIKGATCLRQLLFPHESTYRLIFGESDQLSGLVVDKYEDYFVIQILSAGMYLLRETITNSLLEVFPKTQGIILRNNSRLNEIEGLPNENIVLFGTIPEQIITHEEELKLELNLIDSQKTGYFLDQRKNRQTIKKLAHGLSVLDCYTNQGGFALNAALGGACKVKAVDSSQQALDAALRNATLNEINSDLIEFLKSDVSEFLRSEAESKSLWDMVILDPPAFAKNKSSVPIALAAYEKINRQALKVIAPNGFFSYLKLLATHK